MKKMVVLVMAIMVMGFSGVAQAAFTAIDSSAYYDIDRETFDFKITYNKPWNFDLKDIFGRPLNDGNIYVKYDAKTKFHLSQKDTVIQLAPYFAVQDGNVLRFSLHNSELGYTGPERIGYQVNSFVFGGRDSSTSLFSRSSTPMPVPEPATALLLGVPLLGMLRLKRKKV